MISVVIPAYKKTDQLIANLKNNIRFLHDCEIIIVNDDPSQSIKNDLKPFSVILLENEKNLGFAGAVSRGINKATQPFVFLLNSDVVLLDTSYKKAIHELENNTKLFAVSFAQKEKDGSIVGKNVLYWNKGFAFHKKAEGLTKGENGWMEGGSGIFRKSIYDAIGGFDTLFNPFYWEDIDLSYRAKKQGYKVLFDPNILVEHHHESTIGSFYQKEKINTIAYRNQLLFIWKNIDTPQFFLSHVFFLMIHLIRSIISGDKAFIKGFLKALVLLPNIQ